MRLAATLLALLLWLPMTVQAQTLAPIPALDSPVVDFGTTPQQQPAPQPAH